MKILGLFATTLLATAGFQPALAQDPLGVAADGRIDAVTEWSVAASQLATATGMSGFRTPITLGLVHLAMYDAVNSATGTHSPYRFSHRVRHPVSAYAAATEAGYRVLLAEFPTQEASINATRERLLAGVRPGQAQTIGLALGAMAAQRLLEERAGDGRNASVAYIPGSGPGEWVPTPPGFLPAAAVFLAQVRPFTMRRPNQFRPDGPPALNSDRYADDYNEVKTLGARDSQVRTPEQTATALFWEPLAGAFWPASIRRLAGEKRLNLADSARFQAAAFAAFADSLIACWDAKYHYNFWRPVTAITQGDTDGNDQTEADFGWEPLSTTPNFPEYTSGHACATTAVAYVIEDFFPRRTRIPARNVITGEERFYTRARDVSDEVIEARILLGLHFRAADEDGAEIGGRIADQIRCNFFRPSHRR